MFAILIPTMGGGLLAQFFRSVRVPDAVAYPLGLIVAVVGSLVLLFRARRRDMRERSECEAAIGSLMTAGCMRTYMASAEIAWEVSDYDHGPTYLIKVEPARFMYISSFSPHFQTMGDLRREISVSVAEPVGVVLSASTEGPLVSMQPEKLAPEDVSDTRGHPAEFALLSQRELPESWRRAIASSAS